MCQVRRRGAVSGWRSSNPCACDLAAESGLRTGTTTGRGTRASEIERGRTGVGLVSDTSPTPVRHRSDTGPTPVRHRPTARARHGRCGRMRAEVVMRSRLLSVALILAGLLALAPL